MKSAQRIAASALAVLLALAGFAWWKTEAPVQRVSKKAVAVASAEFVDESTYATAQRLADLATRPEEQTYVQSALRVADHELALAFTAALRDVEAHPPKLSPEALKIQDRVQKSQSLLDADQRRVTDLTAAIAAAKPPQKDALQDELALAQSQLGLDKDELEEANQDLLEADGDPQQAIEIRVQEHDAQVMARAAGAAKPAAAAPVVQRGSLQHFRGWLTLRQSLRRLRDAEDAATEKAATLKARRSALATDLDNAKGGISELAQHTNSAKSGVPAVPGVPAAPGVPAVPGVPATPGVAATPSVPAASGVPATPGPPIQHSHQDAATLLNQTKTITSDQKLLTLLERQAADQRQLAGIYHQWGEAIQLQARSLAHDLLLDALIVIAILLIVILLDQWLQRLLDKPKLDRRQVETLRSITRVSLRVIAVVIILLIVVGAPSQFGTMIGIVGAGLTVALKDFIVAFFGWLVLMGRNGIRLGDWVEINGVSGEVVELGMFHTVLLETGNWSDAGHPTGRRVTFTNSFAIEKHYFNFSTSGQWLWDELQVVVPTGRDPYAIADSIRKLVLESTAEGAQQAEAEWQRAVPAQRASTFSGAPGVNVKPVVGGVEISVRYLTRAHERFVLRAKLYHAAVDLLGEKPVIDIPSNQVPPRTEPTPASASAILGT